MKTISFEEKLQLLNILKKRFEQKQYVADVTWEEIYIRISENEEKLWSLFQMEQTGGEPNVIQFGKKEVVFYDCSPQTPSGRLSLCYDEEALESRKKNKPVGSAWGMATSMGIEILNEDQYRFLQTLGEFDTKTSSWLDTPNEMRKLGGALFGDRRYARVFTYHNGAESYYSARGFRALLKI